VAVEQRMAKLRFKRGDVLGSCRLGDADRTRCLAQGSTAVDLYEGTKLNQGHLGSINILMRSRYSSLILS
jgi:hypothetical protein